jgi:hypothetical protein
VAKKRETFTATCVRRLSDDDPKHVWTHYRVTGKGIPEQDLGPRKYHKNVIVSAVTAFDGRKEVALFAADKNGEPVRRGAEPGYRGALVTLWGGRYGTISASEILKEAGATKVTSCSQVPRGPLDRRRRRR